MIPNALLFPRRKPRRDFFCPAKTDIFRQKPTFSDKNKQKQAKTYINRHFPTSAGKCRCTFAAVFKQNTKKTQFKLSGDDG